MDFFYGKIYALQIRRKCDSSKDVADAIIICTLELKYAELKDISPTLDPRPQFGYIENFAKI